MTLGFCSFASSSAGNCYLIKSQETNVLIDVGISGSQIIQSLRNQEIEPNQVAGVYLTHEHTDHIKSVLAFHKRAPQAQFIASAGTFSALKESVLAGIEPCMVYANKSSDISLGDLGVKCFDLSHDAIEPIAYSVEKEGKKVVIVTDTGCITEEIFEAISGADILVLEANYEENILLYGRYPYSIKRRILSEKGHLSNEMAGQCLCRFLKELDRKKVPKVFLGHLSKENNTPTQAFLTVRNILEENDFYVGKDIQLEILTPEGSNRLITI